MAKYGRRRRLFGFNEVSNRLDPDIVAFISRVEADGGSVESAACLSTDLTFLKTNPDAPAGYTVQWSASTVGSSAEFIINLVGGAGYTYTYAVTDTQATEVTGTGVMGGDTENVTADLSTLVDGTVTLAVYLTGAGGDGNVVTDTANLVGYTGLLDTYSGAAAAYSLRLLDTSYTGDAIVVRRASDNTTQNIGFVNNELDTATLESFCSGTDGFVTTWFDQSGQGNDATNASASSQPKIVDAGVLVTDNGKPAVDFDGVNDFIETGVVNFGGVITAFIAAQSTSVTDDYYFDGQGSNNRFALYSTSGNNQYQLFTSSSIGGVNTFNLTTKATAGSNNLLYLLKNGASSQIAENGGTAATGTLTTDDFVGITIGARFNNIQTYADKMREFIVYPSDQSANRTAIETNINTFYSIYP